MTDLNLLPIPASFQPWRIREVEKYRANISNPDKVEIRNGVRYWRSNNTPIPAHAYKDAFIHCPPEQIAADRASTDAFLADYRESRKNHVPSAEERFEMRAAFGEGATVVNVITGQKYRT